MKKLKDSATEAHIKATAKHIFFAEGKIHATTQEIADAAQVNRSLVHYYFRSRDLLFQTVISEAKNDLKNILDEVLDSDRPFEQKLKGFIDSFLTEATSYPFREIFIITESINQNLTMEEGKNRAIMNFLIEIKAEMVLGHIRMMNPKQFMINLFSLMTYPIMASRLHGSLFEIGQKEHVEMAQQRRELIFNMIYSKQ